MENQQDNKKLMYLMGTSVILGTGFLAWYFKYKKSGNTKKIDYSREQIVQVLKRFQRDYFPVYKMLWTTHDKITKSYKSRYGMVPEALKNSLHSVLMEENPQFHILIADMEDEIYSAFNIPDRKAFEEASMNLCKTDNEVKLLIQGVQDNIKKSAMGIPQDFNVPLKEVVTLETTFKIYKSAAFSVQSALNEFLQEYTKDHETINPYDEEFNRKLGEVLSPEKIKKGLLKIYKYDDDERYHELFVFSAAVKKYSKSDNYFERTITQIDRKNQEMLQQQLSPMANLKQIRKEIDKIMMIELEKPIIQMVEAGKEPVPEKKRDPVQIMDIDEINKEMEEILNEEFENEIDQEGTTPKKEEESHPTPIPQENQIDQESKTSEDQETIPPSPQENEIIETEETPVQDLSEVDQVKEKQDNEPEHVEEKHIEPKIEKSEHSNHSEQEEVEEVEPVESVEPEESEYVELEYREPIPVKSQLFEQENEENSESDKKDKKDC